MLKANDKSMTPVLDVATINKYLESLQDSCDGSPVFDIHVHATEVLNNKVDYQDTQREIISTRSSANYRGLSIANIRLDGDTSVASDGLKNRISELAFTRTYQHTGARVLRDQMTLARVDKAVLLPVAPAAGGVADQMEVISSCCSRDPGLLAGYSVGGETDSDEIEQELANAIQRYNARMVKIHPNVSGIDISTDAGKTRTEAILRACDKHSLPVIIHGGCSPILGDVPASRFSTSEKLCRVDWSVTRSPVVIAHFGIYGCAGLTRSKASGSKEQFVELLESYPNLFTDTSGVPFAHIESMLGRIEPSKVLFGSDAMYVPMYRQAALVIHALNQAGSDNTILRQVFSENASRVLGRV